MPLLFQWPFYLYLAISPASYNLVAHAVTSYRNSWREYHTCSTLSPSPTLSPHYLTPNPARIMSWLADCGAIVSSKSPTTGSSQKSDCFPWTAAPTSHAMFGISTGWRVTHSSRAVTIGRRTSLALWLSRCVTTRGVSRWLSLSLWS